MSNTTETGDLTDGYEHGGELFKCFVASSVHDVSLQVTGWQHDKKFFQSFDD